VGGDEGQQTALREPHLTVTKHLHVSLLLALLLLQGVCTSY
jgi:hypothetical protein